MTYYAFPGVYMMPPKNAANIQNVIRLSCEYFGIDYDVMLSPAKPNSIVLPRHMITYFVKHYVRIAEKKTWRHPNLLEVAKCMNKNHSTIIHSLKTHEALFKHDPNYRIRYKKYFEYISLEANINNTK